MADNPFVGPSYRFTSLPASVQRTVNMMPVPIEVGNERVGWIFKDVPGLVKLAQIHYYTSWPYPLFVDEAINADRAFPVSGQLWVQPLESINADRAFPVSGTIVTQLHIYNDDLPNLINADRAFPLSGTLIVQLHIYNDDLPNLINADRATPLSGTLVVQLVTYTFDLPNEINADRAFPLSGTLV